MPSCAGPAVLDPAEVDRALALDTDWAARLRAMWLDLAAGAVFGDLRAPRVGALPRLRKQVLDAGERLRALTADRAWIPQPRERLKNALASALALRETLDGLASAARELGGADGEAFRATLAGLRAAALDEIAPRANEWAALLDRRAPDEDNSGSAPLR
jgi:hypothetical protein